MAVLLSDVLSLKFLPYCAHIAVVVLDTDIVVLDEFFEGSRIVAEDLGVADLVVGIGYGARLSGVALEILVKGCGLGYGHAIEVVDQVFWPVKRRMRRIEPQKHAERLGRVSA